MAIVRPRGSETTSQSENTQGGSFEWVVTLEEGETLDIIHNSVHDIPNIGDRYELLGIEQFVVGKSVRRSGVNYVVSITTSVQPSGAIQFQDPELLEEEGARYTNSPSEVTRTRPYYKKVLTTNKGPDNTVLTVTTYERLDMPDVYDQRTIARDVLLPGLTAEQLADVEAELDQSAGVFHVFRGRVWKMLPVTSTATKRRVVVENTGGGIGFDPNAESFVYVWDILIQYQWITDMGSIGLEQPEPAPDGFPKYVFAPDRAPWHEYIWEDATEDFPIPLIETATTIPEESDRFDPDGWRNLPGAPLTV